MRGTLRIAVFLCLVTPGLLVLGACGGGLGRGEPNRISCPEIFILKDTDRVARFLADSENPEIKNLVFEARSTFGDGTCRMRNGELVVTFQIGAYVKTTALFDEERAAPINESMEMFVGVRDRSGDIISRQVATLQFTEEKDDDDEPKGQPLLRAFFKDKQAYDELFPEDLLKIATEVDVNISVPQDYNPADYKIYLGIRVSESELANNRRGYLPNF